MYSSKSSGFVLSSSLPTSPLSCFISFVLLELNHISLCIIVQLPGHLMNLIVPFFQLTSGLCLTNQLCPKNMSVLSKSVTAASSFYLWLLILISRGATLVTSLFFVLSMLHTLKEKLIDFIWIFLSLTSCLLIPMWVHLKSTNALTFNFLPFFVLTFACTFNSLFPSLAQRFRITYLFWEFTWEISCTVPTRDLRQNPAPPFCCLHHPILLKPFSSSSSAFLCSSWQYTPSCCI